MTTTLDKRSVLIVLPDTPFPARKNEISVRYYPIIEKLSREMDVHVVCHTKQPANEALPADLLGKVRSYNVVCARGYVVPFYRRILAQFLRMLPVGIPYFAYDHEAKEVARLLKPYLTARHDAVLWVFNTHVLQCSAPYLNRRTLVLDSIDSMALHVSREQSVPGLIKRIRTWKTLRWESKLMSVARRCLYISPVDAAISRKGSHRTEIEVLPNGIFTEDIQEGAAPVPSPCVGFLGNMAYVPNIQAARRLIQVFGRVREKLPSAQLYIIGRESAPKNFQDLDLSHVHFSGTVDNIWPHVNAVDLFVFPMVSGGGQQNKLLEVMWAAKAVVCTSVANGGIQATAGECLEVADDDDSMTDHIVSLLEDKQRREKLAKRGQEFVRTQYDWDRIVGRLAELLKSS